ncbi:hypothetical protein V4836_01090 [Kluyvera ascorbata]|uniref:Uncharacterized protein n=1 Tax=Kluyvera ascorbata TaxID=51288 RepID=A0AB35X2Y8_9ENTR
MSIFEKLIAVMLNIICAVGATLVLCGLLLVSWFVFVSELVSRFYWGGGAFVVACLGYVIYRYAFQKIHKKWEDRY